MCRIFPDKLPTTLINNTGSKAEIKMYRELASQLDDKWLVFYHISWLGRPGDNTPVDGEADFIILHPDLGALVVEVKGGRITFQGSERTWYSTDKHDNSYKIDPFRQAIKSKYALLEKIRKTPGWKGYVELYHCVAFPDVVKPRYEITPECPPEIIIDHQDLSNLPKKLLEIFRFWQNNKKIEQNSARALAGVLESMLVKTVCLENPLASNVMEEEREIIQLTEQQFKLLDFLSTHRRAAIGGCAGSGKTLMAAEKAKRKALDGDRTLLVCFNRSLGEYLSTHLGNIPNLTVSHFHLLCTSLAEEAGLTVPEQTGDHYFSEILPTLLVDAAEQREDLKFDAIIVDEGQDFREYWWLALQSIQKNPDAGTFYVFFDNNQAIYCTSTCIPDELPNFSLSENLRNTRSIFKLVSKYHKAGSTIIPRGPEGRNVEMIPYRSGDEMLKSLRKQLHRLITEEHLSSRDISVLSMKSISREGRSYLQEGIKTGNFTLCRTPTRPDEITLSIVYSFKLFFDSQTSMSPHGWRNHAK